MTSMHAWWESLTDEQLVLILSAAVGRGDLQGAVAVVHLLAVRDPTLAQDVLDTLELGCVLADAGRLTQDQVAARQEVAW